MFKQQTSLSLKKNEQNKTVELYKNKLLCVMKIFFLIVGK